MTKEQMFEDILKNEGFSLKDRGGRISSLTKKLRAALFKDLMRKVEALCVEYHKDLQSRGIFPETYKDWKEIEEELLKTVDDALEKTSDKRMRAELIGSKHYIKYMINIMLIHHLDLSEEEG